ncbi:putative porin [Dysgonomonas reticulitermitis]
MKKYIVAAFLFIIVLPVLKAQNRNIQSSPARIVQDSLKQEVIGKLPSDSRKIDTTKIEIPNTYAWKITPRLGERIFIPRDTAIIDFHQSMLVDGKSVAMGYLGNVGSPAQSKIFFERPETSRFTFMDAMYLWRKSPETKDFLNTKVPYSEIKYQSAGGGETAENRFQAEISTNMGKKLNIGFDFDYIYSRGFYTSLSNKGISYDVYASYIGDKYKMHAFFHNNNFTNIENGGIADTLYITSPNGNIIRDKKFSGNSRDIPVRMQQTWNKLRGRHIYITNRYDLGNNMEEYPINDSTMGLRQKKDYISPASVILTSHYTDQRRRFSSNYTDMDNLYTIDGKYPYNGKSISTPVYSENIDDYMAYYSFKNTLALAMNEGFRKWIKFGLTAFIEYDLRKYSMPTSMTITDDNTNTITIISRPGMNRREPDNVLTIGGVLTKEKGKYLRYKASGEFSSEADYKLEGELTTMLKFKGKDFSVKANAYIKNTTPSFFEDNFASKYWNWKNEFKHVNRKYIGGEINFPELPFSKTKISGGIESINNYIYYDKQGLPVQYESETQVYAIRLDQKFNFGIFHWDSQVIFQQSEEEIIPLPKLSFYTNIYITTKLAKVLTLQLGADAHFHTKYYMPGYQPLTMQFYNQRDMELGNFPIATAYLNMHLKYTRFFVMMYNVAQGMGNGESFSLYRYPVNPRGLKLGISWRFNN